MAFFIKNFETITAGLIAGVSQSTSSLTDFNIGSKTRTMLEAFAQELEMFYHQMMVGIMEGIDAAVDNSFDFPPLPAVAASGTVRFKLSEATSGLAMAPTTDITIPAGFKVRIPSNISVSNSATAGTSYSVASDTIWKAGDTFCNVTVVCDVAGKVGRTIANAITQIVDDLPYVQNGVYSVSNPVPFVNGEDQEDAESHRLRFARYLQSLSRGTLVALETAALTATVLNSDGTIKEQVLKAVAVEPYMQDGSLPVGHVDIYVYNGVGGTSDTLVQNAQKIIDGYTDENNNRIAGYKAAGIIATVLAAKEQSQSFNIKVKLANGYSLTNDMANSIAASIALYISELKPGDSIVFNKIIELVMAEPGIYNCIVESPNGDVAADDARTILTVGDINITADSSITIISETYNT